jgi:hypothetical protein
MLWLWKYFRLNKWKKWLFSKYILLFFCEIWIITCVFKKNAYYYCCIGILPGGPDCANFCLSGDRLLWVAFCKLQEYPRLWGYLFLRQKFHFNFDKKNRLGLHFRRFFHKRIRGRCYDHNFQQFILIFGEKNGVFVKNQCYDQHFK